jgi:hypothetical protein
MFGAEARAGVPRTSSSLTPPDDGLLTVLLSASESLCTAADTANRGDAW